MIPSACQKANVACDTGVGGSRLQVLEEDSRDVYIFSGWRGQSSVGDGGVGVVV